jgi:D-glycero-D-manno-heptose 1,7-bisphosphate phosphatase
MLDERGLRAIMSDMIVELRAGGAACAAWICCPHRPDEGCACRKPGSLMLERAAELTGVRLERSVLIGDSPSDAGAAQRVGMESMLIERNSPRAFAEAVDRIVGAGAVR